MLHKWDEHTDKVLNPTPIKQTHRRIANPSTNHPMSTTSAFKEPQTAPEHPQITPR